MKYRYLPQTDQDKREMLDTLGVSSVEDLFADIPEEVRFKGALNIPEALSEPELVKYFSRLANKNVNFNTHVNFLGAGVYQHYMPSTVNHMLLRGEFLQRTRRISLRSVRVSCKRFLNSRRWYVN